MPGWRLIATSAAYCTGVTSKVLAWTRNSAKEIWCSRRMRWPGISMRRLSPIGSGMSGSLLRFSLLAWRAKVDGHGHITPLTAAPHFRYTDNNRQYTDELAGRIVFRHGERAKQASEVMK